MTALENLFSIGHTNPVYNETTRVGLLYMQSWAVLHYWYFGRSDISREKADRFLRLVRKAGDDGDSLERLLLFRQVFGMEYSAMLERVRKYIAGGKYFRSTLPTPKITKQSEYTVRAVSEKEIRRELIELDFRANRSPESKLALLQMAEINPRDARIFEALGSDALLNGDVESARQLWEQALGAGSQNPAILRGLCGLEANRWFKQFDFIYFRLPEETAGRLRALGHQAIRSAPDQTEAYELLAWVEATTEQTEIGNVNLVQRRMVTGKDASSIWVALALVRIRGKDFGTARAILDELAARDAAGKFTAQIAALRAYMDGPAATDASAD
jgi:hypothetical protein